MYFSIYPTWFTRSTGTAFLYIFVQTFVWRAKLSHLVKPVCKVRHMRKQLGTNFKLHVISCFLS